VSASSAPSLTRDSHRDLKKGISLSISASSSIYLLRKDTGFRAIFHAVGGASPYRWRLSGRLPKNLKLVTSKKQTAILVIHGTPDNLGLYPLELRVADNNNLVAGKKIRLVVKVREKKHKKNKHTRKF